MLKVVMIFMLFFSGWAAAQNDDDQKDQPEEQTRRPSWSSGLPERQKADPIGRPGLSNEFKDELTIDRSELGLQRPEISISSEVDDSATSEESPEVIAEPEEQPAIEQQPIEELPVVVEEPVVEPEPEPVTYEWLVLEQADVEFPTRGIRNQVSGWVDVEVTLNPQGDVVNAEAVANSNGAAIYVDSAERSIRNWIFQAPQEQGVNELVSKVYRIDFVPPPIEQAVSTQPEVSVSEELTADSASSIAADDYQWRILNQVPLDYPMAAARKRLEGWVDILVTINADGEVINLEEENYSSRGRVFVEPAKDSLQQWQFEPPKNSGITQNLSRSYRIEFKL